MVGSCAELAPLVRSAEQAAHLAAGMHRSRIPAPGASLCVPLFVTSSVSGAGLQLLHTFLSAVQPTISSDDAAPAAAVAGQGMQGWCQGAGAVSVGRSTGGAHFQIDGSFEVAGVGKGKLSCWVWTLLVVGLRCQQHWCTTLAVPGCLSCCLNPAQGMLPPCPAPAVYSGTVVSGSISVGSELLLGPLEGGSFRRVAVSGIHRSKRDVATVEQGQHATLAVHQLQDGAAAEEGSGPAAVRSEQQQPAQQEQSQQQPQRADSASCLHAWMQQTCSAPAVQGLGGTPPSTPSVAIQVRVADTALVSRRSDVQLGGSQQEQQSVRGGSGDLLQHAWGSAPQLAPASSGPAPRPRKVRSQGCHAYHPGCRPQRWFWAACLLADAVVGA